MYRFAEDFASPDLQRFASSSIVLMLMHTVRRLLLAPPIELLFPVKP